MREIEFQETDSPNRPVQLLCKLLLTVRRHPRVGVASQTAQCSLDNTLSGRCNDSHFRGRSTQRLLVSSECTKSPIALVFNNIPDCRTAKHRSLSAARTPSLL